MDCKAEWESIHTDDLWVYNKLFLSRVLGYNCGPSGVPVPQPGSYIIRPSFNIMGMGRSARIEYIEMIPNTFIQVSSGVKYSPENILVLTTFIDHQHSL